MQEITLLLFVASLACGGAVMIPRKVSSGAWMLSTVMSVLAVAAVLTDESMVGSEGFDLTLMLIAPFVIFLWSILGMLFRRGADRWREGARRRTS